MTKVKIVLQTAVVEIDPDNRHGLMTAKQSLDNRCNSAANFRAVENLNDFWENLKLRMDLMLSIEMTFGSVRFSYGDSCLNLTLFFAWNVSSGFHQHVPAYSSASNSCSHLSIWYKASVSLNAQVDESCLYFDTSVSRQKLWVIYVSISRTAGFNIASISLLTLEVLIAIKLSIDNRFRSLFS